MSIPQEQFNKIFNSVIFGNSKSDLLKKISENPNRYVGIFRPTKPKTKIIQNILQSHEIRFGDALERIIEKYLEADNFNILEKSLVDNEKNRLEIDQLFQKDNKIYFVEQKVRDDHDSSKKRGQIDNFEKKLNILAEKYGEKNLQAYFYFIDDSIKKNGNYYIEELNNMSKVYNVPIILCYGKDLFDNIGAPNIWVNMVSNLKEWRNNLPDLPETNFEQNIEESFNEIKDLSPTIFRKILENTDIKKEIFPILFPSGKLLEKLSQYFITKSRPVYKQLSKMCKL